MKKFISLLTVIALLSTLLCGCIPFFGNNNAAHNRINGVLPIPNKGQIYCKRIVYSESDLDSISVNTTCANSYLAINGSAYDEKNGTNYISVLFDSNGNVVYDGAKNGKLIAYLIDGKVLGMNIDSNSSSGTSLGSLQTYKYILVDPSNGNEVEFFEGYVPVDYKNGYWTVSDEETLKCGILDEKGNIIIPCQYDAISTFDDKGGAVILDYNERKYGMVDEENNLVIPLKYTNLIHFNGGTIKYCNNGFGVTYDYTLASIDNGDSIITIDRSGNEIFNLGNSTYELGDVSYGATCSLNLIPVEVDNLYGFIDMQGNEVIPPKYNKINCDFVNGYACVAIGANFGVINSNDETIIPFEYSDISPFDQKGFAIAKLKNDTKSTVIDLAGNIVYQTDNNLETLGYGFFKEGTDIILLTTDNNDYSTYDPTVYTKK